MAKKTIAQLSASFVDGATVSGSNFEDIFDSNFNLAETGTSTAEGSLFLKGNLTANEYILSSSVVNQQIIDVSGSTHFGDSLDDVHTRTGSMSITGSLTLNGSAVGGGATDLNGLADVEVVDGSTPLAFSMFLSNGTSPGAAPQHGTLNNASRNLAIMAGSLASITSGDSNICIGFYAGNALTSQGGNVLIGDSAGKLITDANAKTTAIGFGALDAATTGTQNTAVGYNAGSAVTLGDFNTLLGSGAGDGLENADKNIIIGYEADGAANSDNQIAIGDQVVTTGTGDIKIGDGDGEIPFSGSSVTGDVLFPNTASAAYFTGSFAGDGSGLTNLPSSGASVLGDLTDVGVLGSGADWSIYKNGDTPDGAPQTGSFSGVSNIAIGYRANYSATTDQYNIAFGDSALYNSAGGDYNFAAGYQAAYSTTTGQHNIAIGDRAVRATTTSNHNVGLGREALLSTTGGGNIGIGQQSGRDISSGTYNVVIGYNTSGGSVPTTGDKNICLGMFVGVPDPTADGQFVLGHCHTNPHYLLSGDYATSNQSKLGINLGATGTGNARAAVAPTATLEIKGQGTTDATANLLIKNSAGTQIMKLTDSGENVCIGSAAGDSITATSGLNNILIGRDAGTAITTADNNIIIGAYAGDANTASSNIFIGYSAGTSNTTGTANTFIGYSAGLFTTDWQNSTYVGYNAGKYSANEKNTAVGAYAMQGTTTGGATTAELNTAIGFEALFLIDDNGDGNVAVGYQAGDSITSGTNNTVIGYGADADATGTNQIACGNGAVAAGSNTGIWGNASVATNNITVDWTVTSDERIKENIQDSSLGLDFINELKPKTYTRKHPADWDEAILEDRFKEGGSEYDEETGTPIKGEFDTEKIHNGLIAQEVKATMDLLGVEFSGWNEDSNGKQGIQYAALVVPLIKAVQELSAKVKQLENK